MKKINLNLSWVPELYFIFVSILWYYQTNKTTDGVQLVNFPAVLLIVVFHIQLFLNDPLAGKLLAATVAIASAGISVVLFKDIMLTLDSHETQWYALKAGNIMILNAIMAWLMYNKYNSLKLSKTEFNS